MRRMFGMDEIEVDYFVVCMFNYFNISCYSTPLMLWKVKANWRESGI